MIKILNVGCGYDSYGTDRIDRIKTDATTQVCDLEDDFPFASETFDEVYCKSVLEHIQDLKHFISECRRVLKEGGKLFIRTDNAAYLPFHLFNSHEHNRFLETQYEYQDRHYHLFVESHLTLLLQDFREIKINYIMGGKSSFRRLLLSLLPRKTGYLHIEVNAIK